MPMGLLCFKKGAKAPFLREAFAKRRKDVFMYAFQFSGQTVEKGK
jgi:hypothetical protein